MGLLQVSSYQVGIMMTVVMEIMGPDFLLGALRAPISSFAPFGRSGRETHAGNLTNPVHPTHPPNKSDNFQEISKSGGEKYCLKLWRNPFDQV